MQIEFSPSQRTSLGVEWELQLVDRETRQLTAAAGDVLAEMTPVGLTEHPKAKHELLQSCVEVITGVCGTVADVRSDLGETVAAVRRAADARGLGVLCAGTHPLTDWTTQQITDQPRYAALIERNQWLARQLQIFGVHVHVGIRGPDKAMPIVNALLSYLPHFLALSASSPYWIGSDTGLSSYRSKIFEALPTAGLPYQLSGWDEFEKYMQVLIETQAIESIREVWWDIRPHPGFGTVELRICDGLPTIDEVCAVAAMAQCLVHRLDTEIDRGYTLPAPAAWIVRENKWRAARYGLDADIVVDTRGSVVPVRQAIAELIDDLAPISRRLGCADELATVGRIVATGGSCARQRAVAASAGGDLAAVVDALIVEMEDGLT